MIGSLVFSAARISSRTRPSVVSCAGLGDFDFQQPGQILGAGEDLFADLLVHRQRFAGDVGLIDRALTRLNDAVRGDVVAGADAEEIADDELAGGDFFLTTAAKATGFGRGEFDEGLDGSPGAGGGAGFDDLAQQHEERDDAGGPVIPLATVASTPMATSSLMLSRPLARSLKAGPKDGPSQNDRRPTWR